MDTRVIAIHDQEVLGAQEDVIPLDDLSFLRGARDAQPLRRRAHDGAGLEHDHPVLLRRIVRMNRHKMARNFSLQEAHGRPVAVSCPCRTAVPSRVASEAARSTGPARSLLRLVKVPQVSDEMLRPANALDERHSVTAHLRTSHLLDWQWLRAPRSVLQPW